MTQPPVVFREIEVRRMPGFITTGMPPITGLSAGVNIIYGPNASGKTTLSRAIQRLIRAAPDPKSDDSLRAVLDVGGSEVLIDDAFGRVVCHRDGQQVDVELLAPADLPQRYLMALDDLIVNDDEKDRGLAEQIVRESSGGFGIQQAAQELGFKPRPSGHTATVRALKTATDQRQTVEKQQRELAGRVVRRDELQAEFDRARDAANLAKELDDAIHHARAREALNQAQEQLNTFDPRIDQLAGDELETLERFRKQLEDVRTQTRELEAKRVEATKKLKASPLPDGGVPQHRITELKVRLQRLRELDGTRTSAEQSVVNERTRLKELRDKLPVGLSDEQLDNATGESIAGGFEWARRAQEQRNREDALTQLQRLLTQNEPDGDADIDSLRRGIDLLHEWRALRQLSATPTHLRRDPLVAAGIIAVVALTMGLLIHPSWFFAMVFSIALAAWSLAQKPTASSVDESRLLGELNELDLAQSDSWQNDRGRTFLNTLQRDLAQAELQHEFTRQQQRTATEQSEIEKDLVKITNERLAWEKQHQFPAFAGEAELVFAAEMLRSILRIRSDLGAAEAALQEAQNEFKQELAATQSSLAEFAFEPAAMLSELFGQLTQLEDSGQEYHEASQVISNSTGTLEELNRRNRQTERDLTDVYVQVGLTQSDHEILEGLLGQLDEFRTHQEQVEQQKGAVSATAERLENPDQWADCEIDQLQKELIESTALAEVREDLRQKLSDLDAEVGSARTGVDLETALLNLATSTDALKEQRANDLNAMLGNVLVSHLDRADRSSEQSKLFGRASELFDEFTNFRHRLVVSGGETPSFRAIDTSLGIEQELHELSSGTKVQLRLAVRVAYLESQEQRWKLPLLLDEMLATSDEQRAQQIIEAGIKLARTGRQIFYLTAQHDEVGKWQTLLKNAQDVEHVVKDLAEIRQFDQRDRVPPMELLLPTRDAVAEPYDGEDRASYGKRISVPSINPRESVGNIHLWYLIDDVEFLHRLLKLHINRWGQFEALAHRGSEDISESSEHYLKARSAIHVIQIAIEAWARGRGRPVDKAVLLQSGEVSETFLDRVDEVNQSVGGDARALIEQLETNPILRFQNAKRDQLREYLIGEGYLDERERLEPEEILEQVLVAAFRDLEKGRIDQPQLELLVKAVADDTDQPAPNQPDNRNDQ